jgi:imidazole glycerol-phosphate synthase subunit HisH
MRKVAIVDYGMSNLDSVARAVEECGGSPSVVSAPAGLVDADQIILPGVGAFPLGIRNLRQRSLSDAMGERVIGRGVPLLGICLGMQLLARRGLEGAPTDGLGWIEGDVRRLTPESPDERVPHIGWNEVVPTRETQLLRGVPAGADFYFVHSYHLDCHNPDDVAARTPYAGAFVSVVERPPVFGVQFHPEKSQRLGFAVLKNFLTL